MKMTTSHPNYIKQCPACKEAIICGFTFEETHSSRKKGFLETEKGFIKNPHLKTVHKNDKR